jgi:hypothetical protein
MKTPAGKECKFFFGDYYRGRNREECRLLQAAGERWTRDLCRTCPVPGVLQANACEFEIVREYNAPFETLPTASRDPAYCEKCSGQWLNPMWLREYHHCRGSPLSRDGVGSSPRDNPFTAETNGHHEPKGSVDRSPANITLCCLIDDTLLTRT